MSKIEIISKTDQDLFNAPPVFSADEQLKYFKLTPELSSWIKDVDGIVNKVGFILLWGYSQAGIRFYQPSQFHEHDLKYVCQHYKFDTRKVTLKKYNQRTFNYHKQVIRKYINLYPFDDNEKKLFLESIKDRVLRHYSPKQIFLEVFEILKNKRIEVPSYNYFALNITQFISDYEKHLFQLVEASLLQDHKEILNDIVKSNEDDYSKVSQFKNISHSRRPKEIKENISDFKLIGKIYKKITPLLAELNLHTDTIKHYATWVKKAGLFQINQLQHNKRYLYLICFIIHQYQLRQDIFADILLSSVQSAQNAVSKNIKEDVFKQKAQQKETLHLLSESRITHKSLLKKIEKITKSQNLSDTEKIEQIKKLIEDYNLQNNGKSTEPKLDTLSEKILNETDGHDYYCAVEDVSLKLQNRVSDILRNIEFDTSNNQVQMPIMNAIQHYQNKSGNIGKEAPVDFLSDREQDELYTPEGKFKVSLYKALLDFHAADAIKSGTISLKPAYRYLSIENYLHPKDHWEENKNRLLEEAGLIDFADINKLIEKHKLELDEAYHETNRDIKSGKNLFIKFDNHGRMILATPKVEKINTQSVSALFSDQKYTSILKILSDVHKVTNFLDCFRHHNIKDKKILPKTSIYYASILGMGCNIGINKMANVSKGITEDSLLNFVNWHMTLDNVDAANKKVLDLLSTLSLTKVHQKNPNKLHTSSDGRKVGISVDSLNANSSFKYFGSGIGCSLYTFIDEVNRLFYSTSISSSEREAAYVVDGLLHNLSIKSSIHSTDTHGYSEAVFAILNMIGTYFAPRIKNLKKSTLYSFESRSIYEEKKYKILPTRYIDVDLIKKNWDDILRLMVTIKLKETTMSQILKRLSSYSKQHPLYCAIKEYGRIIKSLFILKYIDDVELRQDVERQLNRIELSNKFSKAISFGNNQEIQYSAKEDQEIVVGCQRLIQNSIVLWNELFLSQKIANAETEEEKKSLLSTIRNGTTLIWHYVNLHGEYDFTNDVDQGALLFDMNKILALKVA